VKFVRVIAVIFFERVNLLAYKRLVAQNQRKSGEHIHMSRNPSLIIVATALLCLAQSGVGLAQTKKPAGGAAEHANKGVKLVQSGAFDEAIAEFTKAIKLSPDDARIYDDRGWAYYKLNRFPEAMEDFSKAIELAPKDYAGYSGRGVMLVAQNQNDAALVDLNKALELKPDDAQTLRFRASAYKSLKQYDLAIEDYTAVLSKTDPNANDQTKLAAADLLAKRGYVYSLAQQYENAINDYKEAIRLNPGDIDTPQRLQYAQSMLAAKNAPPPPSPTPTPTPAPSFMDLLTPLNIGIAIAVLIIIAVVVRLLTRGKEEPTSGRIR
jgi:tetratricopeptide (TPR) repeat protein